MSPRQAPKEAPIPETYEIFSPFAADISQQGPPSDKVLSSNSSRDDNHAANIHQANSITNFSPFSQYVHPYSARSSSPTVIRSSDNCDVKMSSTAGAPSDQLHLAQANGLYQESSSLESPNRSQIISITRGGTPQSSISSGLVDWSGEIPRAVSRVLGADFFASPTSRGRSHTSIEGTLSEEDTAALHAAVAAALRSRDSKLKPAAATASDGSSTEPLLGPAAAPAREQTVASALQGVGSGLLPATSAPSPFTNTTGAPAIDPSMAGMSAMSPFASVSASDAILGLPTYALTTAPSINQRPLPPLQHQPSASGSIRPSLLSPTRAHSSGLPPLSPQRRSLDSSYPGIQGRAGSGALPYTFPGVPPAQQGLPQQQVGVPVGGGGWAGQSQFSHSAALQQQLLYSVHEHSPFGDRYSAPQAQEAHLLYQQRLSAPQLCPPESAFMPALSTPAPDPSSADHTAAAAAAQAAAMHALSSRESLDETAARGPLISPRLSIESTGGGQLGGGIGSGSGSGSGSGEPQSASGGHGSLHISGVPSTPHSFGGLPAHETGLSFFPAARYSKSFESSEGRGSDETIHSSGPLSVLGPQSSPGARIPLSDSAIDTLKQRVPFGLAPSNALGLPSSGSSVSLVTSSIAGGPRVTVLVSSNGLFQTNGAAGGGRGFSYAGGDVRLVGLPMGCTHAGLVAVLAKTFTKTSGSGGGGVRGSPRDRISHQPSSSTAAAGVDNGGSSVPGGSPTKSPAAGPGPSTPNRRSSIHIPASPQTNQQPHSIAASHQLNAAVASRFADLLPRFCIIRYKLPSDPDVWVDVVDDDDVALMFDEMAELKKVMGATAPKLHMYVEWLASGGGGGEGGDSLKSLGSGELCGAYSGFMPASGNSSLGSDIDDPSHSVGAISQFGASSSIPLHNAHRSAHDLQLAAARTDNLEIIPPHEVTVVEMLGTGSFGDMYKGFWRECQVSVKCLNLVLMGLKFSSKAAWLEFLQETNRRIGALRHPNLVEVYGIVLPTSMDPRPTQPAIPATLPSPFALSLPQHHRNQQLPGAGALAGASSGGGSVAAALALQGQYHYNPQQQQPIHAQESMKSNSGHLKSISADNLLGGTSGSAAGTSGCGGVAGTVSGLAGFGVVGPQRLPGVVQQMPAMVMEYVAGRSLTGAIRRHDDIIAGKLTRVLYAMDCARALAYLHSKSIVHLNFKSGNVLLSWRNRRPTAKVAGYNLNTSKSLAGSYTPGVTTSRNMLPWVAPETIRAPQKVSYKADVYSFGVVMWEMWAFMFPFIEGMAHEEVVQRLFNCREVLRPPLPGASGCGAMPEPGPGWSALMQRCWQEDPDQRPEMSQVAEELKVMAMAVKKAQQRASPSGTASARKATTPAEPFSPPTGGRGGGGPLLPEAVAEFLGFG